MSRRDVLSVSPSDVLTAVHDVAERRRHLVPPARSSRRAARRASAAERAALADLLLWLDGDQRLAPGVDLPSLAALCEAATAMEGTLLSAAVFGARTAAAAESLGEALDATLGLMQDALRARRDDPSLSPEEAAALELDLMSLAAPVEETAERARRSAARARASVRRPKEA